MDYTPVCLARAGINEAGMRGMAYGWGATGPSGNDCKDPKPTKPILQETELTVCSELESTDNGIVDGQLCAIGASSITYSVIIKPNSLFRTISVRLAHWHRNTF